MSTPPWYAKYNISEKKGGVSTGFSRGAALTVHFTNEIGNKGVKLGDGRIEEARVCFLGLWDIVGSFGLSFDTFINFQKINLGLED